MDWEGWKFDLAAVGEALTIDMTKFLFSEHFLKLFFDKFMIQPTYTWINRILTAEMNSIV